MQRDFPFFCSKLKVRPKNLREIGPEQNSTLVPFIWNEAQRHVWSIMVDMIRRRVPIRLVICKARQVGISTLMCAYLYWLMWRRMYTHTLIVGHLDKTL